MNNRVIKFKAWDTKEKVMLLSEKQEFILIPTSPSWGVDKHFDIDKLDEDISCFDWASVYLIGGRYIPLQFTGLFDKNGKEIYEGDVIRYQPHTLEYINDLMKDDPDSQRKSIVPSFGYMIFNEGQFKVKDISIGEEVFKSGEIFELTFYGYDGREFSWSEIVIIGNIYENPELLKK